MSKFKAKAENLLNSQMNVETMTDILRRVFHEGLDTAAELMDKHSTKAQLSNKIDEANFFFRIAREIRAIKADPKNR